MIAGHLSQSPAELSRLSSLVRPTDDLTMQLDATLPSKSDTRSDVSCHSRCRHVDVYISCIVAGAWSDHVLAAASDRRAPARTRDANAV